MQTLKWERTVTPSINISFHLVSCIALLSQRAVTLLRLLWLLVNFSMIASMSVYLVDSPTADVGHLSTGCVHGIVNVDVISSDGGAYISMDEATNVELCCTV